MHTVLLLMELDWMMGVAFELRLEARPSPPSERRRGPARVRWVSAGRPRCRTSGSHRDHTASQDRRRQTLTQTAGIVFGTTSPLVISPSICSELGAPRSKRSDRRIQQRPLYS